MRPSTDKKERYTVKAALVPDSIYVSSAPLIVMRRGGLHHKWGSRPVVMEEEGVFGNAF